VARIANEAQLEALRLIPGARVNVFPLGLEEIFLELYGQPRPGPGVPAEDDAADKICPLPLSPNH
jgi:hypothetical protein